MAVPQKSYRYLPKQWAEALCNEGTIRLSTTTAVTRLETQLRDENDCRITETHTGHLSPEEKREVARRGLIYVDDDSDVTFVNSTFVREVPGWMLCCSLRPDNTEIRRKDPSADTVVEITDNVAFIHAVIEANELLLKNARSSATAFAVGKVKYGENAFGQIQIGSRANPFLKARSFAAEEELRFFWFARIGPLEPLLVTSDRIRQLVQIVGNAP